MGGYLNDPAANAQAFHGRWFRTGDLGLLDEDGYLFLQGRIKELINRGGEKIAPVEIDEALARHPAVAEAAAYPVPDERLGEEIAALVVLKPAASATIEQLRHFCAAQLSAHKLPRWIQLAPRIPRTAAGKVNRRSLAEQFPAVAPEGCPAGSICACEGGSVIENFLLNLWRKHLRTADVGRHTDFFEAGGDSLTGTELLLSIESALGTRELGPSTLLEAPSVEKMAVLLNAGGNHRLPLASSAAPFPVAPGRPPIYLVAPSYELRVLRNQMPPGQPLIALGVPEPPLIDSLYSMEKIAEECVRRLRKKQPYGPYFLGGWCFAGIVAYEMAMQLMASGESVPLLIAFDLPGIAPGGRPSVAPSFFWPKLRFHSSQLRSRPLHEWPLYVTGRLQTLGATWRRGLSRTPSRIIRLCGKEPPRWLWNIALAQAQATREYRPAPYPGRALHFVPGLRAIQDKPIHWAALASGTWETFELPGTHLTMFESDALGVRLRSCLQSLDPPEKISIAAAGH
jgi:thioesterase domain-containing protein